MTTKSVRIDEETFGLVKAIAECTGIGQQKLLNNAIKEYIRKITTEGTIVINVPRDIRIVAESHAEYGPAKNNT